MNYKKSLGAAIATLMIVIVIFVLAPGVWAASKYKTLHKFTGGSDGGFADAGLIFDTDGNLYGTTNSGGAYAYGTVFKLTPNQNGSWTENVLYSFTGGTDGNYPMAGLIFDRAGNLYGTTGLGGNLSYCYGRGCGAVFKLTPNLDGSWTESVLHSFTTNDGQAPEAGLIFDSAGNLYGTTYFGGAYGYGVAFELSPNADGSWKESVLHSFTGSKDGSEPQAGLTFDQAGNLYGTTWEGGAYGYGVVFELTPNPDGSWKEKVLHRFTGGKDGSYPYGGLIFDEAGNLYSTTFWGGNLNCGPSYGCGTIFKLSPNPDGSWKEKVLHQFSNGKDGGYPYTGVIFDGAGNLYGTSVSGGTYGKGVVFKLAPDSNGGWHETVLHTFAEHPGAYPTAGVIFDTTGNLYGTTYGEGPTNFGSVFEITP